MVRGARRRVAFTDVALLLVCLSCLLPAASSDHDFDPHVVTRRQGGDGVGKDTTRRPAVDAVGDARVIRLRARVVSVDAELEAELNGRPPFVRGHAPSPLRRRRGLLETIDSHFTGNADARWGLLDDTTSPDNSDDPESPTWADGLGDVTQFLVATDGTLGGFERVASALELHGGGVAGIVPPASYVAIGSPSAAASVRDLAGTVWVGPLVPADVVAAGWDLVTDAAALTTLHEDGRALLEVSIPLLFVLERDDQGASEDSPSGKRKLHGAGRDLAEALAAAFQTTAAAAAGDPGAWATPMAAWARPDGGGGGGGASNTEVTRVLVGVRPEGLVLAIRALAAHRGVHLIAPRHRKRVTGVIRSDETPRPPKTRDAFVTAPSSREPITRRRLFGKQVSNEQSIPGLQGDHLTGTLSETPFWDVGLTGTGQVIGIGDTGADRTNCYLDGTGKFAMYETRYGTALDEHGHGTHVSGSAAGSSVIIGANADGSAFDARIAFMDLSNKSDGSIASPTSMGAGYYCYARSYGARIHSDSWGSNSDYYAINELSAYTTDAREVDAYADQNLDFLPMFAAGNEGPSLSTYSIPSNAKNTLAIGAALSPNSGGVWSWGSSEMYCDPACAAGDGPYYPYFSFLAQVKGEHGVEGLGVYALQIGGPHAKHWAHMNGQIRTINAVRSMSLPKYGTHEFAPATAIAAVPIDACSPLQNAADLFEKVVIVDRAGSCYMWRKVKRATDAGAVAVLIVNAVYTSYHYFPSYTTDSYNFVPLGRYFDSPFFYPEDAVPDSEPVTIPVLGVPKKEGELLIAMVVSDPHTTLSVTGTMKTSAHSFPLHENLAYFSSGGPTHDGRVKPDLVVPGDAIESAEVITSASDSDSCDTVVLSGTSMATPLAAGTMAILRQYFTDGYYPTGTKTLANVLIPSAALLRAVAINGARALKGFDYYGNPIDPPPSSRQGWGRLNLASSVLLKVRISHPPHSPETDCTYQTDTFFFIVSVTRRESGGGGYPLGDDCNRRLGWRR